MMMMMPTAAVMSIVILLATTHNQKPETVEFNELFFGSVVCRSTAGRSPHSLDSFSLSLSLSLSLSIKWILLLMNWMDQWIIYQKVEKKDLENQRRKIYKKLGSKFNIMP